MISRIVLIVLTLFWLTMNILLWRAEYGREGSAGSSVPAEVVWRKILTAPDSSSLSIFHHGKKVGFCHWVSGIGEELAQITEDNSSPEGMVRHIRGYRLQLEGNVSSDEVGNRIRFESALTLTTNQLWQDFNLRIILRPAMLEIHSSATEQRVKFHVDDGEEKFDRVIKFSELQNPQALLREFGGPVAGGLRVILECLEHNCRGAPSRRVLSGRGVRIRCESAIRPCGLIVCKLDCWIVIKLRSSSVASAKFSVSSCRMKFC